MNVAEAAAELGVSPRRVRAIIGSGRITARKTTSGWDITDLGRGPHTRRPLSDRSRHALARALHTRSLQGLTGHDRARTAARILELRTTRDAAQLLVDWWGGSPPAEFGFAANLVEHALAGNDRHVDEMLRGPRREYLRLPSTLADIVCTERTIQGMTRRRLAESAGVSLEEVRRIERAEPAATSPAALRRVLRALDVQPTALPDMVLA